MTTALTTILNTVFIPINAAAFIFFESVVGEGVYWRAASIGGRCLIIHNGLVSTNTPRVTVKQ